MNEACETAPAVFDTPNVNPCVLPAIGLRNDPDDIAAEAGGAFIALCRMAHMCGLPVSWVGAAEVEFGGGEPRTDVDERFRLVRWVEFDIPEDAPVSMSGWTGYPAIQHLARQDVITAFFRMGCRLGWTQAQLNGSLEVVLGREHRITQAGVDARARLNSAPLTPVARGVREVRS